MGDWLMNQALLLLIQGSLLMYIWLGTKLLLPAGEPAQVSYRTISLQSRGLSGDEDVLGLPLATAHKRDIVAPRSHRATQSLLPYLQGAIYLQLFQPDPLPTLTSP